MAYVNAMNIKLNNPKNLLYPEILTQLPLEKLAQVSVSTMQDTSVLVETILSKISLSTVNQLKSLKPEVIMAMNPFQLQYLDESLIGQGDYAPLLALVPGTLTQDQANAFLFKVNPPPANVNQTLSNNPTGAAFPSGMVPQQLQGTLDPGINLNSSIVYSQIEAANNSPFAPQI